MDLAPSYSDVGGDEHEYEYENKYDVINDANVFAVDGFYNSDGSASCAASAIAAARLTLSLVGVVTIAAIL